MNPFTKVTFDRFHTHLKLRGKKEVTEHDSSLNIKSQPFRTNSLHVVMQIFTRFEVWLSPVFESIEARKISRCFRWNESEIEWQTVFHERHGHPLNDGSSFFELLEYEFLDLPVPIIELFNLELVEDTNSDSFKKAWGVDFVVSYAFNISYSVKIAEVKAVRIMLIWSLHQIYFK